MHCNAETLSYPLSAIYVSDRALFSLRTAAQIIPSIGGETLPTSASWFLEGAGSPLDLPVEVRGPREEVIVIAMMPTGTQLLPGQRRRRRRAPPMLSRRLQR